MECLLRGTDWVFKYISVERSTKGFNHKFAIFQLRNHFVLLTLKCQGQTVLFTMLLIAKITHLPR